MIMHGTERVAAVPSSAAGDRPQRGRQGTPSESDFAILLAAMIGALGQSAPVAGTATEADGELTAVLPQAEPPAEGQAEDAETGRPAQGQRLRAEPELGAALSVLSRTPARLPEQSMPARVLAGMQAEAPAPDAGEGEEGLSESVPEAIPAKPGVRALGQSGEHLPVQPPRATAPGSGAPEELSDLAALRRSIPGPEQAATPLGAAQRENQAGGEPVRIPTPIDPERLMESIARTAVSSRPGQYQVTLRLHPEHLGEVKLLLELTGKEVRTVLQVTSPAAREALESRAEQLRQGLRDAGLSLTGFEVSTGQSGHSRQQSQFDEIIWERRRPRPSRQPAAEPVAAPRAARAHKAVDGRLDTLA